VRTDPPSRWFLSIQMASRDPAAWGDDSDRFVLRPMSTYHKLSVAWADPAIVGGDSGAPNSRVCPGKELSFVMINEFLCGFLGASLPPDADPDAPLDPDAWVATTFDEKKPEVDWTGYGINAEFRVAKKGAADADSSS